MRRVPAIDATGMAALRDVVRRSRRDGTLVLLADVHMQPMVALSRSAVLDEIGAENLLGDLDLALARARAHLGLPPAPAPDPLRGAVPNTRAGA